MLSGAFLQSRVPGDHRCKPPERRLLKKQRGESPILFLLVVLILLLEASILWCALQERREKSKLKKAMGGIMSLSALCFSAASISSCVKGRAKKLNLVEGGNQELFVYNQGLTRQSAKKDCAACVGFMGVSHGVSEGELFLRLRSVKQFFTHPPPAHKSHQLTPLMFNSCPALRFHVLHCSASTAKDEVPKEAPL